MKALEAVDRVGIACSCLFFFQELYQVPMGKTRKNPKNFPKVLVWAENSNHRHSSAQISLPYFSR